MCVGGSHALMTSSLLCAIESHMCRLLFFFFLPLPCTKESVLLADTQHKVPFRAKKKKQQKKLSLNCDATFGQEADLDIYQPTSRYSGLQGLERKSVCQP